MTTMTRQLNPCTLREPRLRRGFTLLELIVVMLVVGLLMGVSIPAISSALDVKKKAAAQKISANIKYLYDRAVLERVYIRLVFDLDNGTYYPESTSDPFFLREKPQEVVDGVVQEEDEDEDKEFSRSMRSSSASELFNNQESYLFDDPGRMKWQGWEDFAKKYKKKKAEFKGYTAQLSQKVTLPPSVTILGMQTRSLADRATQGKTYLHFFPTGRTEAAVIYLVSTEDVEEGLSEDEMEIYTVLVSPLSGRAQILDGLVALPEVQEDDYEEMDG